MCYKSFTMNKIELSCILVPYDNCNPYQTELIRNLNKTEDINTSTESEFKTLFKAIKERKIKPDIVHLHWIRPSSGTILNEIQRTFLLYYRLKKISNFNIKIIWTIHNYIPHEIKFPRLETLKNKLVYSAVSACIVHSNEAKIFLLKQWKIKKDKINVIPHGNYIFSYPNRITKKDARNTLNIPSDIIVFANIGNIRKYKGIEKAIRAFSITVKEHLLLIVGRTFPNSYQTQIENLCKGLDNIKYISEYINVDKMQVYMNASDIILLTHINNNLTSGAAILAMSFGLPCIAPDVMAFRSILDEKGAFFFNPEDKFALSKTISKVITQRNLLPEMGTYNLKRAKKWDWETIAKQTSSLYQEVLEDKI